jgi:hypothetical protein
MDMRLKDAQRVPDPARRRRMEHVLEFLEKEIWPAIPPGRPMSKKEHERILGYRKDGV